MGDLGPNVTRGTGFPGLLLTHPDYLIAAQPPTSLLHSRYEKGKAENRAEDEQPRLPVCGGGFLRTPSHNASHWLESFLPPTSPVERLNKEFRGSQQS